MIPFLSVSTVRAPLRTSYSSIQLTARFPNSAPTMRNQALPAAQTSRAPSGDQRQPVTLPLAARNRGAAPAGLRKMESATTYAAVCPSGDHCAQRIGPAARAGASWRGTPPDADTENSPRWLANRIRVPSGDQLGETSTAVESPVSSVGRPPLTCLTYNLVWSELPPAYARNLPSGESAGWTSMEGS